MNDYPFEVGDRVSHRKDPDSEGTVISIDANLHHPTTCTIQWDDAEETDIQWTNKLVKIGEIIDIPDNAMCVTIHDIPQSSHDNYKNITWLSPVKT